jgi:hypothetical protein
MIELFDPKVCFARELKSSWCCNIKTPKKDSARIPIANVGQEICLHFDHNQGSDKWFLGLIPVSKGWTSEDLSSQKELVFNYFADKASAACVGLRDEFEVDSGVINISKRTPIDEAICEIRIPLDEFKRAAQSKDVFNINKSRFVKFTGGGDDSFYISRLRIE